MSKVKQIFNGFFWTLVLNLVNALYGFISVPLLLSHFGKENFGIIGITISINFYLKLLDMGFTSGNVKFFSTYLAKADNRKLKELFQSSLLFYIIVGLLNILVLTTISIYSEEIFSFDPSQNVVFKKLVLILIVTSLGAWVGSVMEQFLRANGLIGWQQRILLLSKLIQMGILFLTIYFNLYILSFFLFFTIASLIPLPFYIQKIKTLNLNISFFPKYHQNLFIDVLPYSISIFSFSIFQFSANYIRPIILGIKVGLVSVTEYRIIEGFASFIMILGASFVGIILPVATKVKSLANREKEFKIAYDGTKYISVLIAFLVFGFLLVSDDLMILYVGKDYNSLVIWLNIWIITLLGLHNSGLSGLVLSNNSLKPIVYMSAISTIVSLISAWFLVEKLKIGGVIVGYSLYVFLQLLFYYCYYYPIIMGYNSKKIFFQSFFKPTFNLALCFSIIFSLKSYVFFENRYYKIISLEILFTVISLILTYFLTFNKSDRLFFTSLIFKRKDVI